MHPRGRSPALTGFLLLTSAAACGARTPLETRAGTVAEGGTVSTGSCAPDAPPRATPCTEWRAAGEGAIVPPLAGRDTGIGLSAVTATGCAVLAAWDLPT